MKIFLSGGAKSGKSALAQDLAVRLSAGGPLYYVATMVPVDEEDCRRIHRHVEDRAGMGFTTVECDRNILSVLQRVDPGGTFLLDSVTALLANEMFDAGRIDYEAGRRCAEELADFVHTVENAVVVSDGIYADSSPYETVTELYRGFLALADRVMADACDTVVEMVAGVPVLFKGDLSL